MAMEKQTTVKTLPADLVSEIFLWLPVKSLLRFRGVSKSSCSMIDDPNFIKQHLERSMETKTNRKLIIQEGKENDSPYVPEEIYAINFDKEPQEPRLLNHPYEERLDTIIYGSCNGLLLLFINERLALWNPFTRQCKKLPLSPLCLWNCAFGLGYDYASDDYKVVKISVDSKPNRLWVFSLKSNSWRSLPDFPYTDYSISSILSGGFLANGALHWLLLEKNGPEVIIAFDLANETFCVVPQPVYGPRPSSHQPITDLHVLEGCLCMSKITYVGNDCEHEEFDRSQFFELYVRENHGIGFIWRKLYADFQGLFDLQPLAYSSFNLWLLDTEGKEIICYDLHEKRDERVQISIDLPYEYNSFVCWESLVPLGDGSEFDGDISWETPNYWEFDDISSE
ncbi:hypothetical protein JCGZ_02903 [Jatropha curcas]|uniref:F-box domain-containing protein n=1 Tax=Jatropha curcas TaxID=180498 RepID=A0A067L4N3_JATCU|nr:F-box protein CPR1 [Jatropha curcas]KDP42173.1 hypothetical protein JCGZ_02903 [Jatropha curcas]